MKKRNKNIMRIKDNTEVKAGITCGTDGRGGR